MNADFIQNQFTSNLIKIVVSNPRSKATDIQKIVVKSFLKGQEPSFQFESFTKTQAFHDNLNAKDAELKLSLIIEENLYRQINGETTEGTWQILISKKGKLTLKEQKFAVKKTHQPASHNRQKTYLLEEGNPVPFLIALGVMNNDGKVVKKRYDKFRQINRFLETVDDIVTHLPTDRPIKIIDFGCGRSYLTFALYHYLVHLKGLSVDMVGLDLKEKVIEDCNALANEWHYENLTFKHGDIVDYDQTKDVDMVVTLHACDIATDLAIKKATQWHARVILSVPCCQHEFNHTIANELMADVFQYGIIKERMAALMTDSIRGNWLKLHGYEVQIMEFIDMAHTPKNLLIRAVKATEVKEEDIDYTSLDHLIQSFNGDLTLRRL